jgi:hypothetical protein
VVALWLAITPQLQAQPLILSNPTNTTAWVGDSPTLRVIIPPGTPSPTYQWAVSADGVNGWTPLTDGGNYSGTASATLTISNLGGGALTTTNAPGITTTPVVAAYYACAVTSASATATSATASLTIYTAAGLETPSVAVNLGASIASNSTADIPITITGLAASGNAERVRINHFTNPSGSGAYVFGDPLVQSFAITDGAVTKFGGITDPVIPGDEDLTFDGAIHTHISIATTPELGREDGKHIIRVVSANGKFRPVDVVLTVTQPTLGQSISGQVTDSATTNPVPYAAIALLDSTTNNGDFVAATFADATGHYSIQAPPGSYMVFAVSPGYVMSQAVAPMPTLVASTSLTGANFTVLPATCTISANFQNVNNSSATLRGVQLFFQSNNGGQMVLASTDNNGNAVAAVTAQSDWKIDMSAQSFAALGFMLTRNSSPISTLAGSVNAGAVQFTPANALIYGTLKDNTTPTPNPLANAGVRANENNSGFQSEATTDASGNYYLLAWGPASPSSDNWNVGADNNNPIFSTTYVLPPGQNASVQQGHAYPINLVAPLVTAHLSGSATVSPSGSAANLQLDLYQVSGQQTNYFGSTTTDGSGNFSFGVNAGTWQIQLNTNNGSNPTNLVSPVVSRTVVDGDNVTGIAFPLLTNTWAISGTVKDPLNAGVSNANVYATATISSVTYNASAQSDGSGNFSLPVVNGTWTLGANTNSGLFYPSQSVVVNGANATGKVLSPTVISFNPTNQSRFVGNSVTFNVGTNAPGTPTFQWQVSTNSGSTWSNLANDSTYSGATSNTLLASNLTLGLSGNQYRVAVAYSYNSTPVTENSTAATLTVTAVAPSYSLQPSNQTVNAGSGTFFQVNVSGTPFPTTQWQVSTDGGAIFNDLSDGGFYSGATNTVLNVSNPDTSLSGRQYRCVATNVGGTVTSNAATLTVNAQSQSINFGSISSQLMTNSPLTVSASATSGLTVGFAIFSGPATISGNAVTFTGPGTVTVRATQGGNTYYAAAPAVDQSFTVSKAGASVNLGSLSPTYDGTPKSATAFTTPGSLAVSFTYDGSGTAPTNAGSYAVVATVNDTNYQGSASGTLTIAKATATVNLGNLTATYDGTPKGASASTTPNGLPVDLTYDLSSTVPINAGSYVVAAAVNHANYVGTANGMLTISPATQTITFGTLADQVYPVAPLTLSATASSGLAVSFSVISGPAGVSGTTLTITGAGTVTVQADQPGNANYQAAPAVPRTFAVTAGFAAWQAANFSPGELADPLISGPTVVLMQDGLSNLLKYALGLAARSNVTTGLPLITSDGTNWIYTFTKPTAVTDVTCTVEFSTDLVNWSTSGVTQGAPVSNAGTDTIQATRALSGAPNGYFRLKVTL